MSFNPSDYQKAILHAYENTSDNLIIQAVAGAGKTTTLLMLASKVKRSPAVLCAFNNHIAKDISAKLSSLGIGMEGRTIHSLGFSCVKSNLSVGSVNSKKYSDIAKRWISGRRGYYSNASIDWTGMMRDLLDFTRLTMTEPTDGVSLSKMIKAYDLEADERMLEALPELLEQASSDEGISKHSIDFTDMLWLPIKKNLQPKKFLEIFVDESQDLNCLQTEFIKRSLPENGRAVFCGDPRQAIMAFGGADANSFYNIKEAFNCTELPLTFCYRCGSEIVNKARKYVSHIEVPEGAHKGEVSYISENEIFSKVKSGDVVLCRKTAPLVELCLSFIGAGIPARVRGRDMVNKLFAHMSKASRLNKADRDISDWHLWFAESLQAYRDSEISSLIRKDMEDKIESFNDTINCILAVYDPSKHRSEIDLKQDLSELFSDEAKGVTLSTVHRSKGLEWSRVFIYKPSLLPMKWKNQTASQYEQEVNLAYVAVTRAINELVFIKEPIK